MKRTFVATVALCLACTLTHAQRRSTPYSDLSKPLATLYTEIDSTAVPSAYSKPVIGISMQQGNNYTNLKLAYAHSVELAGGVPYLIPVTTNTDELRQIISNIDALVLTGGEDIDAKYYGVADDTLSGRHDAERDVFDLTLMKLAKDRAMPVLGICRGLQLVNVAMGGTLYQDLPTQHPSDRRHMVGGGQTAIAHSVSIVQGSTVASVLGQSTMQVNSRHHQAIKDLAPELTVTAWSPDSIPEAVEDPYRPIMAVQFHPEDFANAGDPQMLKLFAYITNKAATYRKAKEIHSRILSVDTHCDAPLWMRNGYTLGRRMNNQVNIPKMEEGMLDAQFLAAFLSQKERDDASLQKAVENCNNLIQTIYDDVARYPDYCGIAITEDDLIRLKAEGKKAFFIGIENGYAIGKDIKNIERYKKMGVNYITLCHSYDNDICHSSTHTEDSIHGLTAFGRKVVKEMNRVGMMVDLSHASEATFWDVIKISKQPVIASHSGAKACTFHDRNLTDDQLRALAANGGVVQVCIFSSYVNKDRTKASIIDVVNHIDHCVKVAGIDHVGIGSDFDGGGGVIGCAGANDLLNLTCRLLELGYDEGQLRKIWGANFFRVMNQVRSAYKE